MVNAMSNSESVMIVGNWHWDIYEDALSEGFKHHGWKVIPFKTDDYLPNTWLSDQLIRTRCSILLSDLNASLLKKFETYLPGVVFLNRSDLILPKTLKRMKRIKPDSVLLLYHNDNPFTGGLLNITMRHYLSSITIADATLVYRPSNISDAEQYGAKRVELLLPYYLSYRHHPMSVEQHSDVVFIGHYEPDNRAAVLEYLIENGINLKIYGSRWENAQKKHKRLGEMAIGKKILGEKYSCLISSAKIALVFLSVKNRDGYTRRCFEIPACGTMMIAPRTPELEKFFTDGKEAVYYDSPEGLLRKIKYYLSHDEERMHIAEAGRDRCVRDGHDERNRVAQIIRIAEEIRSDSKSSDVII